MPDITDPVCFYLMRQCLPGVVTLGVKLAPKVMAVAEDCRSLLARLYLLARD